MNNEKVIEKFLERGSAKTGLRTITNGIYQYQGRTLQTNGTNLINYSTIIAYFDEDDTLYITNKKYSQTTSKIVNKLKNLATLKNIEYMEF